jgi:hypothetical protein
MDINIPPILIPSKYRELYDNLKEDIKELGKRNNLEEILEKGIKKVHTETKIGKKGDLKGKKTIMIEIKIGGKREI